jgi:rhomboid protease GluP
VTLGDWSAFLTPSGASLLALGGLRRDLVLEVGQWYRLASAAFLHASPVHLLFNGLALYFGGTLLERLVGRRWLLAVFGLSALGGSAASMLLNPPGTLSVGASGAILGLFGAALAVSFRIPYGSARAWAQSAVLRVLVPSLLPLFLFPQGPRIDFWAHLGGALVGLAVGLLLLARWPRDQPRPRLGGLATVLAAGCTLVLAGGLGAALAERPAIARLQALHAALAPDEALRDLPADAAARATALSALQARYPRDPRVLALRASDAGDPREAEELLRRALAELELLAAFPGGRLEATLRAQLARRLLARGAEEEAREAIRPSCAVLRADPSAPLDPEFVRGACGG